MLSSIDTIQEYNFCFVYYFWECHKWPKEIRCVDTILWNTSIFCHTENYCYGTVFTKLLIVILQLFLRRIKYKMFTWNVTITWVIRYPWQNNNHQELLSPDSQKWQWRQDQVKKMHCWAVLLLRVAASKQNTSQNCKIAKESHHQLLYLRQLLSRQGTRLDWAFSSFWPGHKVIKKLCS